VFDTREAGLLTFLCFSKTFSGRRPDGGSGMFGFGERIWLPEETQLSPDTPQKTQSKPGIVFEAIVK